MVDLVEKFSSDLIYGWQNMASIGVFGVKKLPHFYEFCAAGVNVVTMNMMKSLNAVYYESTWSENFIDI